MVPPLADRRCVDRPADLYRARGRRGSPAFVEAQYAILPRQINKFDESATGIRLIPHNVLVGYLHESVRRQRGFPMSRKPAKGEEVICQFGQIIRKRELAAEMRLVHRPARV